MSEVKCPSCDSTQFEKTTDRQSAQLTLGGEFSYEKENYKCLVCGEEGDFANHNDDIFKNAQKHAAGELVGQLIDQLNTEKVSMARFERAFEIPIRTLNRWKTGDFSASALALLRIVKSCPWLVPVAEHRFEKAFLDKTIHEECMTMLASHVQRIENKSLSQSQVSVVYWEVPGVVVGATALASNGTSGRASLSKMGELLLVGGG